MFVLFTIKNERVKKKKGMGMRFFSCKLLFVILNYRINGRGCNLTLRGTFVSIVCFLCLYFFITNLFSWSYKIRVSIS